MISNAIPGITNTGAYANTAPAKGIAAAKSQTSEFYQKLRDASSQKQTAAVSVSVTNTLTKTVNNTTDNTANAAKSDNTANTSQNVNGKDNKTANDTSRTSGASDKFKAEDNTRTDETAQGKDALNTNEVAGEAEVVEEPEVQGEQITNVLEGEENAVEVIPEEESDALSQALLDASRELMDQLADMLDVDIKDIENAMATLGLTGMDILNPITVTELIGQLTGNDDVMAIVTNADLYLNVQNMQDAVDTTRQELMQQFNLSEEELSSTLKDFSEGLAKNNTEETAVIQQPEEQQAAVFEIQNPNLAENIVKVPEMTGAPAEETVIKLDTEEVIPETENFEVEEPKIEITVAAETAGAKEESTDTKDNEDGSMFNQLMNRIASSLSEVAEPEGYGQIAGGNSPEDVIRQITDYIKMNVKPETTTMEMQLHPASLGTINVMIEQAKNGNMVAKFFTQNEDVRAAIESQLQQLQEKFNEQGIKVTAVEVTVNTGGFDQTLNDSQSQKEEDQDAQESIRKPMRRIRLDDLMMDDEMIELDENDQLTAEMMAINGNSVDFSA